MSPEVATNPEATYAFLREKCPVAHSNISGWESYYVSRYDDVCWALRRPGLFSSEGNPFGDGEEALLIPQQVDPPRHTMYRRLLNPEFVPREIDRLEPEVRPLVRNILDGI